MNPWSKVAKICMGRGKKDGLAGLRTDDGLTKSWSESVNMLMKVFFPSDNYLSIPVGNQNACIDVRDFTNDEIRASLLSIRVAKSPGIDRITNEMIKCV